MFFVILTANNGVIQKSEFGLNMTPSKPLLNRSLALKAEDFSFFYSILAFEKFLLEIILGANNIDAYIIEAYYEFFSF